MLHAVQKFVPRDDVRSSAQGPTVVRELPVADLAASFQAAVVDSLVGKTQSAAEACQAVEVLVAGGVAANRLLRSEMTQRLTRPVRFPPISYCTDNAAMVAVAGYYRYLSGQTSSLDLDVVPNLRLA